MIEKGWLLRRFCGDHQLDEAEKAGLLVPEILNDTSTVLTPFQSIVSHDFPKYILKRLVEAKADINAGNPLRWVSRETLSPPLVELLLKEGANPNLRDPTTGNTPLHNCFNDKSVELLILYGADILARNNAGVKAIDSFGLKRTGRREEIILAYQRSFARCKIAQRSFMRAALKSKKMVPDVVRMVADLIWSLRMKF